jgi:transposase
LGEPGEIASHITTIHSVLDNLRRHKGKQVQAWLAKHPRFVFHSPPVHCSWMNQVEQWFSILLCSERGCGLLILPTRRICVSA